MEKQIVGEAGYQGWKNYETFLVALWMDNDQKNYNLRNAMMRRAQRTKNPVPKLAESLKNFIEGSNPLEDRHTLYEDLLNGALQEVNWREIAQNWLDEDALNPQVRSKA